MQNMAESSKRTKLAELLYSSPKPQLHLHLDGSLSFDFIMQCVTKMTKSENYSELFYGETDIPANESDLYKWLMEMKESQLKSRSSVSKNSNWKVFDFCNQFLQTTESLSLATYELIMKLNQKHNVNYFEIRFAPVLHTKFKLTEEEAVKSVVSGLNEAFAELKERGVNVDGGIILCCLRSFPIESAFRVIDLCLNCDGVIGLDIAGDEGAYPLQLFTEVISSAKRHGLNVTVHAGEWNEKEFPSTIDNIVLAHKLNVNRIGHGLALRSIGDEFLKQLAQSKIAVEVCLTANCGNPKKCRSLSEHPVKLMLQNRINVSGLNVDNLLLSGNIDLGSPNPTDECVRALLDCSLKPWELFEIIQNGYNSSFAKIPAELKNRSLDVWKNYYVPKILDILE